MDDLDIGSNCDEPTAAWVYILQCRDGTLYTGYTLDIRRRIRQHRDGSAASYTRTRRPVTLVYLQSFWGNTRSEVITLAMRREIEVKKLSRERKLALRTPLNCAGIMLVINESA